VGFLHGYDPKNPLGFLGRTHLPKPWLGIRTGTENSVISTLFSICADG